MATDTLEVELSSLGLSTEETKVYLKLLELGRGAVSVIAKRSGVQRVNCYHLLDSLVRKSLASTSLTEGRKVYSAAPPENLVRKQVDRLRIAEKILPELKQRTRTVPQKTAIRPIEGKAGLQSILDETLVHGTGGIVAYSDLSALAKLYGDYFHYYTEERLRKRIRARYISPLNKDSKQFFANYFSADVKREFSEAVFVDPEEFPFGSEIYIYGDAVATIALNSKQISGAVIEGALFASSYRSAFHLAWMGATSFAIG